MTLISRSWDGGELNMGAREEFEAAEQKLLAEFGLDYKVNWVEVPSLGIKARILEVGEGEPLVFVHGGAAFAANWAQLMARLKHRRLLAVDRPGFGLTPYVDHHRGLRGMANAFLTDVLDGLGLNRADFVVNSMGGLWAFWFSLDQPERVASMAQLGSPALVEGTMPPFPMRLLSVPGLNRVVYRLPSPPVLELMGEDPAKAPRALTQAFEAARNMPDFEPAWLSLLEVCLRLGGIRVGFSTEDLTRVQTPTLLIWGNRDPFGGLQVARMVAAALPHCRLVELPEEGHLPWVGDPGRCATEIEAFLSAPAG
jgi:pimeloyl-ACP methyl ester carboxylesterase